MVKRSRLVSVLKVTTRSVVAKFTSHRHRSLLPYGPGPSVMQVPPDEVEHDDEKGLELLTVKRA